MVVTFPKRSYLSHISRDSSVRSSVWNQVIDNLSYLPPRVFGFLTTNLPHEQTFQALGVPLPTGDLSRWPTTTDGRALHQSYINLLMAAEEDAHARSRLVVRENFPNGVTARDRDTTYADVLSSIMTDSLGIDAGMGGIYEGGYIRPDPHGIPPERMVNNFQQTLRPDLSTVSDTIEGLSGAAKRRLPQEARNPRAQVFAENFNQMFQRVGPVYIRLPADWRSLDSNENEAFRRAIRSLLRDTLEKGRETELDGFEGRFLLSIELPRIGVVEREGGMHPIVSRDNPVIASVNDINSAEVRDFIDNFVDGNEPDERYHSENYFTTMRAMFGNIDNNDRRYPAIPMVLTFVENTMNYMPQDSTEPIGAAVARKHQSPITVIFKNYTLKRMWQLIEELSEMGLTLPLDNLIPDSRKYCMFRAVITSYLMTTHYRLDKKTYTKMLNQIMQSLRVYARRNKIKITNIPHRELIPTLLKLSNSGLPALPSRIHFITDRHGSIRCESKEVSGSPFGYDCFLWLVEGETHAIPLVKHQSRFAMTSAAVKSAIAAPPNFELGQLLNIIDDMRPDILMTFDYETLAASRDVEPPNNILLRGQPDSPTLHSAPVMDYCLAYCSCAGKSDDLDYRAWDVGHFIRESTSSDINSPTFQFMDVLVSKVDSLRGKAKRSYIQVWAHNAEFDLSIFTKEYMKWHSRGMYKNTNQTWNIFDVSTHNNRFIYVKIDVELDGQTVTITFKDSYNVMSQSLLALCKSFKIPEEIMKGSLDHNKMRSMDDVTTHFVELETYAHNDVISLLYILKVFSQVIDNQLSALSPSTVDLLLDEESGYVDSENELVDTLREEVSKEELAYVYKLHGVCNEIRAGTLNIRIGLSVYTAAGLARKIMQLKLFATLQEQLMALPMDLDQEFRKSYKGGRVECMKIGHFEGKIWYWDFTSLYPTVMLENTIRGQPKQVDPAPFGADEHGIARVRYSIIGNTAMRLPLLCEKVDGIGLAHFTPSPSDPEEGYFTSNELKLAETIGYKIEYLEKWVFQCDKWLEPLTTELYRLKVNAEQTGQNALRQVAKIIINSSYGFWALKHERAKLEIETIGDELLHSMGHDDKKIHNVHRRILRKLYKQAFGGKLKRATTIANEYFLTETADDSIAPFQNVAVAAWITANARIKLWTLMNNLLNLNQELLYCDTDSVIFRGNVTPGMIAVLKENGLPIFGVSSKTNELGCLTNELGDEFNGEGVLRYAEAIDILGLKQYCLHSPSNGAKKMAMKGIPLKRRFHGFRESADSFDYLSFGGGANHAIDVPCYRGLALGEKRYINVLYDSFKTGLSNLFSQPLINHVPAQHNQSVDVTNHMLHRYNGCILKDFDNLTRHFGLNYCEQTRKCCVGYSKGKCYDLQSKQDIPRTENFKLHHVHLRDSLRRGGIGIRYFKNKKEIMTLKETLKQQKGVLS